MAFSRAAIASLLAVASSAAVASTSDSTAPKRIVSPQLALRAIDQILCCPKVDSVRPQYRVIVDFAEASELVEVTLDSTFFSFSGDKPLDAVLLAYFIAGAVKFDLAHPNHAREPAGDIPGAIRGALVYYRAHRLVHPDRLHPLFERFDTLERDGKLEDYIQREASAAPK